MAYTAPDPEQFSGMEEAYSYLAPLAAVNITMPAYVFSGPCLMLSRIIYLNQCNPGEIMKGGATWLLIAQHFSEAKEALETKLGELSLEDWDGDDRKAFDEKAQKILGQLENIQAFAMHIGISLMLIATMLAVMVPIMLAFATVLMGLAIAYMIVKTIVPAGPIMAEAWRGYAMAISATALTTLKTMDKANGLVAQALAAFIGANMTISWVNMASLGNIINPASTIGSTAYSLLDGLANLAFVKLMAPGNGAGKLAGTGVGNIIGKATGGLAGAAGAQGVYGIGNNAAGDAPNKMTDAGVNVGLYDFVPDSDKAREGDNVGGWTADGLTAPPPPEEAEA
jgi:hypothetical protein